MNARRSTVQVRNLLADLHLSVVANAHLGIAKEAHHCYLPTAPVYKMFTIWCHEKANKCDNGSRTERNMISSVGSYRSSRNNLMDFVLQDKTRLF
jgi:hypothetical protein